METLKQVIQANPWEFSTERSELINRGQIECLISCSGEGASRVWAVSFLDNTSGEMLTAPAFFHYLDNAEGYASQFKDIEAVDRCLTKLVGHYDLGNYLSFPWALSSFDAETGEFFSSEHFETRAAMMQAMAKRLAW